MILWDEKNNTEEELASLNKNLSVVFKGKEVVMKIGSFVTRDNCGNVIASINRTSQMYVRPDTNDCNFIEKDVLANGHTVLLSSNVLDKNDRYVMCDSVKYVNDITGFQTLVDNYYVAVNSNENVTQSVRDVLDELEKVGFYKNRCNELSVIWHLVNKGYIYTGGEQLLKLYDKKKIKPAINLSPDNDKPKISKTLVK